MQEIRSFYSNQQGPSSSCDKLPAYIRCDDIKYATTLHFGVKVLYILNIIMVFPAGSVS